MNSFTNPYHMYLFRMKNGRQKIAYGESPEDALEIMRIRLTDKEMTEILPYKYIRISPQKFQNYIDTLG
jgi:hypothetical protein